MHYVYKITNIITNKYYVGRTCEINKRFDRHKKELRKGIHHSVYLQRAWDKYGETCFEFLIIEENLTLEEAQEKEQKFLDNHKDNLYNVSFSSGGGDLVSYHPGNKLIRMKISSTLKIKNSKLSQEERNKLFGKAGETNPMYGKKHSKETMRKIKRKLKEYYKDHDGYRKGKTFEELFGEEKALLMRKNLSKAASKRKGTKNPFFGKKHTEETKAKLREINLGKPPTNQRPVLIDEITYPSATEASRQLGVVPATILHRIKSKNPKYQNYFYIES